MATRATIQKFFFLHFMMFVCGTKNENSKIQTRNDATPTMSALLGLPCGVAFKSSPRSRRAVASRPRFLTIVDATVWTLDTPGVSFERSSCSARPKRWGACQRATTGHRFFVAPRIVSHVSPCLHSVKRCARSRAYRQSRMIRLVSRRKAPRSCATALSCNTRRCADACNE